MRMLLLLVPMVAFASVRLVVNINVAGSLENPHMPMQSLVTCNASSGEALLRHYEAF